ncbi:hypothetical protein [Azospira sp. I13]|uniref:hypothetical protein n=1 Tax=Azospira sp. I13 TaxID=1765050 RepID=UPI0019125DBE|nr:hypothetical protein [Azospira sp. I13]
MTALTWNPAPGGNGAAEQARIAGLAGRPARGAPWLLPLLSKWLPPWLPGGSITPLPAWRLWAPLELRVDVDLRPQTLEAELESLYRQLQIPGGKLHGLPAMPTDFPGLVLRLREADGELYVYVEDRLRRRLAGYTVFNRLVEVGKAHDPLVRAPHSRYGAEYQRQGIASAVYEWALAAGWCLVSGARQSVGAHALWRSLARRHVLGYVSVRGKRLAWLGSEVAPRAQDDLQTRMVLLGRGWDLARFIAVAPPREAAA